MGFPYEIISTPPAYLKKALVCSQEAGRSHDPVTISFGPHRLQHCVLWEPDVVTHDVPVMYFHGGGYLVGTPESMIDAANVYNSQGYRFCSVGFRLMPRHPFPAQVDDAFSGIAAALQWLEDNKRPAQRFVVGGSSCGGHLAMLVGYGSWLQRKYHLDASRVAGVVSVAGITHVDDMLLKPIPPFFWKNYIALPTNGSGKNARHKALVPYSPYDLLDDLPDTSPQLNANTDLNNASIPPFFAIHGRFDKTSPYRHEAAFGHKLKQFAGDDAACLYTVEQKTWQHMWTTVTLHKDPVSKSAPLASLFLWLSSLDEPCASELRN